METLIKVLTLLTPCLCTHTPSPHLPSPHTPSPHFPIRHTNIVLLIADDLGIGDVGCFGNTSLPTPNIDRLASQGVRLTHHLAAASVCTPSRAALLTGRYPIRTGLVSSHHVPVTLFTSSLAGLPPEEVTLAELVKQKDYHTALIGKWHLGLHCDGTRQFACHPKTQGFDSFYGLPLTNMDDFREGTQIIYAQNPLYDWYCLGYAIASLLLLTYLHKKNYLGMYISLLLMSICLTVVFYFWFSMVHLKFLNSVLLNNYTVVEQPIQMTTLTDRLVAQGRRVLEMRAADKQPFLLVMSWIQVHTALHASRTKGQSKHGSFGDEVMELDWSVGQILTSLSDLGLEKNTLVYFTSDQGPHVELSDGEGNKEGGYSGIYRGGKFQGGMEGGIRVPTVVKLPGVIPAGVSIHTPTSQMDLVPTVVELLGLRLPTDRVIDGVSLLPLLQQQKLEGSRVLVHYCGRQIHAVRYIPDQGGSDVWKLLLASPNWLSGTEGCGFYCQCRQVTWHRPPLLYNIAEDPSEQYPCNATNTSPPCPSLDVQQRLVTLMQEAIQTHSQSVDPSVTNQYALHRLIPMPWLQPCCNFPLCHCVEEEYSNNM